MKKILTILLLGVFLFSFVSAEDKIGTFKNGVEFNITNFCSTADCSYMIIKSITYPNGSVLFLDVSMNKVGQEFTYNFSSEDYGPYYFRTCADPKGSEMCERDLFIINPTGADFTTAQGFLYFFILALIGLFLFFSINGIVKADGTAWLIGYISLTYILIYALIGICYLLAGDYLWASPIVENILFIVWLVMGVGFLPFIIVLSMYLLGQEAMAVLEEGYIKQGYSREDAKELSRKK